MALQTSRLAERGGRLIGDGRRALGLSQRDLSRRTGIPQSVISRFERGQACGIDLTRLEQLATALGGRVGLTFDAPFLADRVRQRDRVHAWCVGFVARRLRSAGWQVETEVEIEGAAGPGWIDVLAFHPESRWLLVIEVKTEIQDFGRIQRTLAWYEARAPKAARARGWAVDRTHACLLVLATEAVDLALSANRALAAAAFPARARNVAALVMNPGAAARPIGRSLAMIDPFGRRRDWVRPTRLDGRSTKAPHRDYASVVRRLGDRGAAR